ncbi:aminoacyl-tRNA deacylase [Fundidesulfovibrio terrae]|uniref:aminoacyl-tRNA deacylase n=1 Tax=Fundidesulfovibrio terrae TaxID=2922866 RepID=UPI001FAF20FB|nr:aminoacyl-tRNA deacylase [Fundidesulfovibrio terrae]
MSKSAAIPATGATRFLKEKKVPFEVRLYSYVDHGGTERAAEELGVDEHVVVKTLVFEDEAKRPFLVLMHGDNEVSLKELARQLGVKTVTPCSPDAANRHTGYQVGGISPFGTRKQLPVYAQKSIFALPEILINAGKRGALAALDPKHLRELLDASEVDAAR